MLLIMFYPKLSHFFLAIYFCFYICAGNFTTKRCIETDKQALLKLKDSFIVEGDSLSSWKDEVDCCKWNGISCNNLTGHVTRLDLRDNSLATRLRVNFDSSLCDLQHLTFLDISLNDFEGKKIPKCIGSLDRLRELKLASASLAGTIPHELRNLSNLQTLDLGGNLNLISSDVEWVSQLSSLRYLDLTGVNLSRAKDWQSSIGKVPYLVKLHLDGCELPQISPKSFSHMNSSTSFEVLDLAGNDFNSSILSWVFNSSKVLKNLDLSGNSLQHIAPDAFANMNSLETLYLSGNSLQHIAPDAFANMNSLEILDLSGNSLQHIAPDAFANMNSLETLDLSGNSLQHIAPDAFANMNSLETLDLSYNSLQHIAQSFGNLPLLSELDLSYNNLSGPLPKFDGFSSLRNLYLSNNRLNEILPSTFGELSSLFVLQLSSNKLNGVISEAHLSSLSNLTSLDVSHNLISFNMSSNWVPPFQLQELFASSCTFGPNFPAWLKYQRNLESLDISNGAISDSIPKWLWELSPSLMYLNISHNKIHGALPISLPKAKSITMLDLSFNNLSGILPQFPLHIENLLLSNNMFSGSISSICAWLQPVLEYLDLSSNLLSGILPDCWWKFQFLKVLNLAKNNFSGRTPISIGNLTYIETIHLNNNNLYGEFPSLMHSFNLRFIDFGQNNFLGNLPTWLGYQLPNLIVLRLQENKFQGSIPASLCDLLYLQILDLSRNNVTGQIPHCLDRLIALSNITLSRNTLSYSISTFSIGMTVVKKVASPKYIDNVMLVWKGREFEYGKNLEQLTSIDLSSNHLTGEIPPSITALLALASLNLSRNNLIGFIPKNMGHMKMLESLDLSSNSLSGGIPASFSALTYLAFLNLSFNNLSGKIPQSTQLQTFDASRYMGNRRLCGLPLTKGCPGDGSSYQDPNPLTRSNHNNDKDEDKLISFGFYTSMAFGFIVGFWGVCGTLILKRSWRQAYFQFFSDIYDWIYVRVVVSRARMKRRFQG